MESSNGRVFRDYGLAIGIAIAIALVIRVYFIEAYKIPNSAMRPTLEAGDTIFVAKWPFKFKPDPAADPSKVVRGDVVIFSRPEEPWRDYIKRVLALPGETVEVKGGVVSVNGKPLPVQTEKNGLCGTEILPERKSHGVCFEPPALEDFGPQKVPERSVFVLGDLRSQSNGWGMLPMSLIKARALWIWLSVEPRSLGSRSWFPQFRFERMFKSIGVPRA